MGDWHQKKRPLCLEKRFEFKTYEETRDFLDRLGDYSESSQRFPDISFGRTYVNITIRPESEDDAMDLTESDYYFANKIDGLFD